MDWTLSSRQASQQTKESRSAGRVRVLGGPKYAADKIDHQIRKLKMSIDSKLH